MEEYFYVNGPTVHSLIAAERQATRNTNAVIELRWRDCGCIYPYSFCIAFGDWERANRIGKRFSAKGYLDSKDLI